MNFGALDLLVLGTDWEQQGTSPSASGTRATQPGKTGDIVAENTHNTIESGTVQYIYVGSETDFVAALTAATCHVGRLAATNTLLIMSIGIDYSPCAGGKRPMVTFSFRDGPTSAPATPFHFLPSIALPTFAAANVEVPMLLTVVEGDGEVTNAQYGLSMQFGDDLDADGEFLCGQGFKGEETISITSAGLLTSVDGAGYQQTAGPGINGAATSNTGYDNTSYAYAKGITRTNVTP